MLAVSDTPVAAVLPPQTLFLVQALQTALILAMTHELTLVPQLLPCLLDVSCLGAQGC